MIIFHIFCFYFIYLLMLSGFHYPKATGHPLGNDEKMPIEGTRGKEREEREGRGRGSSTRGRRGAVEGKLLDN